MLRALVLAACAFLASAAGAQPPPPSVALESYGRARAILDAGIAAIGGGAALRDLGLVRRRMTFHYVDPGQQPRAGVQGSDPDRLPVAVRSEVTVWADYRGTRFVRLERYEDGPGDWFLQHDAGDAAGGFGAGRFRDEPAFFAPHSAEEFASLRHRELSFFPEFLLRLARDRAETLQYVGRSGNADIISFADAGGRLMLLSFDAATHRLLGSESLRDHPVLGDTNAELRFDDYRRVGALTLPFRFHTRIGGRPSRVFAVEEVDLPSAWEEALFQPPDRRVPIVESSSEPRLQALGQNVYAIVGPYNVMFAVFRDFVLLAEAPVDSAFAEASFRLIRSVAPGKPVRVVVTHFHSDHVGGVPYAVAQGSPILATEDVRPVLDAAIASHRTLRPSNASAAAAMLDFHPVDGRVILDDGTQRAEIYDVGPTPHADHMLAVNFPRARALLVADLWDILSPDLALGGLDAEVLMHRLRDFGIAFDLMVPVHGVSVARTQLEQGLAIRARYVPPLDVEAWTQARAAAR